ncbi:cation/H(+) antiporter 15-like [Impatiens glandulifera]|uniref:cation/H(+) antiporter 15-like n=1 Tax=Impatiens glandulifera TaxID=253017 RepID=UPI001FB0E0AF|nr:cation/H(+) antiporter 15-like [Impatiens glandulifera]
MEKTGLPQTNSSLICIVRQPTGSKGIFLGEHPLHYSTPVLMAQLSISAILTSTFQYFLLPFGETTFTCQTLTGLILGPSGLGKIKDLWSMLFPKVSFYIGDTISFFGLTFFLFLVGVKMDITIVAKSGKKAIAIGLCNFFVPLVLNECLALFLMNSFPMDPILHGSISWVATFQSISSFYVINGVLTDLKLLNSEMGRLATSASMISGLCTWIWCAIIFTSRQNYMLGKPNTTVAVMILALGMIFLISYVLRPIMLWMARRTGDEKAVSESYISAVLIMLLCCSMMGEAIGQHFMFGPMVLGLAVPEGPPLGSALVTKLEAFVSLILLPLFFVVNLVSVDVFNMEPNRLQILWTMTSFGFIWKMMATIVPSLYCQMKLNDAVALALILSVQGITDILILNWASHLDFLDSDTYNVMVVSILIFTSAVTPIIKIIYKPYRRYVARHRRTVEHAAKSVGELRMLACLYNQDHTPLIINLLEASAPTNKNPICLFVVHLIELVGRAAPVLVSHRKGKFVSSSSYCPQISYSEHIIRAFRIYEDNSEQSVAISPFTAISPFATMHDEICSLSLDKKVSMIILPFHRSWNLQDTMENNENSIQEVNRRVLELAPCSVAILVDRGRLGGGIGSTFNLAIIFLGGKDDREALAFGIRMSKHPKVRLSVVNLIDSGKDGKRMSPDSDRDSIVMERFKANEKDRCRYKEELVGDSVDIISAMRTFEKDFDMIMVGRDQNCDTRLLIGLAQWSEAPELGYLGDMLSSVDSSCKASVLVVQQQSPVKGILNEDMDSPKSCAVVDMPFVWSNMYKS